MKILMVNLLLLFSFQSFAQASKTIPNRAQDGDLILQVNDGGVATDAVTVDGATGNTNISGLTLSGGSEVMSAYEVGSWTPIVNTSTGATITGVASHTKQAGDYVKVGRRVTASFFITFGSSGGTLDGTNAITVSGLPYPVQNVTDYVSSGPCSFWDNLTSNFTSLTILTDGATNFLALRGLNAAGQQNFTNGRLTRDADIPTTNATIICQITYISSS